MAGNNEHLLGFAEVCAALSDRFGTSFELQNTGGNCVTLMARLECGIEVLITDCEETLSPAYGWRITSMSPPPGTPVAETQPITLTVVWAG
ncbi:MAG: hypothetical protein WA622_09710 [Mycobacterium sp.]|uniref:PASTA domain-containing protein n=1 Tax=Mycobacterium sp. TaxID=1785 RepID=UPI003BB767AA